MICGGLERSARTRLPMGDVRYDFWPARSISTFSGALGDFHRSGIKLRLSPARYDTSKHTASAGVYEVFGVYNYT